MIERKTWAPASTVTHALTVREPWGWAIISGHKPIENRRWEPGLEPGDLFALHVGRVTEWKALAYIRARHGIHVPQNELYAGAILGVCRFRGIVVRGEEQRLTNRERRWFTGRVGWRIEVVLRFEQPVPCNGRLGLWRISDHVRPAVDERLAAAGIAA